MPNPATPKQTAFIVDLLAKRDVPAELRSTLTDSRLMTTLEASLAISTLISMPNLVRFTPPSADALQTALASVPASRYALSTRGMNFLPSINDKQALLFLEVREYRSRRTLFRLVGAPGRFSRYRVPRTESIALLASIARDPLAAAQRFGAHYRVCGKCAAELTDTESRRVSLGPVCRRAFGL